MTNPPDGAAVAMDSNLANAVELLRSALDRAGGAATSEADAQALRDAGAVLQKLAASAPAKAGGTQSMLFFDVSDLLGYYPYNRLPTGIQRVQINTILNILKSAGEDAITLCRFSVVRGEWLAVPVAPFRSVCQMSIAGGDSTATEWLAEVARLEGAISAGQQLDFPRDACLVNLGTSWWLPNYFLHIRQAKLASNIRYIPLLHDLIPAIVPHYCNPELVHEFIDWLAGVLVHADFFLAVSDSTKADLIRLAAQMGHDVPSDRVAVVPLAAELNSPEIKAEAAHVSLGKWGLSKDNYVLFVSTIEARKNQLGAFDAWQRLIALHGREKVPQLVCVGKRGYEWDIAYARLETDPNLRDKVTILDKVNDAELEALYHSCLFTIYPSFYEGWGLPVTESLCYGKVPLVANNSSLPQAGQGFSLQYETGSASAFVSLLEKLAYDASFRREKEAAIAERFVPRTWKAVAADIEGTVKGFLTRGDAIHWQIPEARPGFHVLRRNREAVIHPGTGSSEIFRAGEGWCRLEDFGTWTQPGGGELEMRLGEGVTRIALRLIGLADSRTSFAVSDADGVRAQGEMVPNTKRWVFIERPHTDAGPYRFRISSLETERVINEVTEETRDIGVGVAGFYVFDPVDPRARINFVEAAALGMLEDHRPARH